MKQEQVTLKEFLKLSKPHKYRAKRRTINSPQVGINTHLANLVFDSGAEAKRFHELNLLQHCGEISNLEYHPSFRLEVNGFLICTYEADSRYLDHKTGEIVIEDSKTGVQTQEYKIKKKLFEAIYGRKILET